MTRRHLFQVFTAISLFLVALYLYCGGQPLTPKVAIKVPSLIHHSASPGEEAVLRPVLSPPPISKPDPAGTKTPTKEPTKAPTKASTKAPTRAPTKAPTKASTDAIAAISDGPILNATEIKKYVGAILDKPSTSLPLGVKCPAINKKRYGDLVDTDSHSSLDYFFALNLRDNLSLLPILIGSILEAIKYLGPKRCALSIVEGNSPDGTADVLSALKPVLDSLGITYYFKSSDIDPSKDERVLRLAQLRNLALEPLTDPPAKEKRQTADATVVFINDVAICAEDILELVHQKRALAADMTCAMDWTYLGEDPTFYDVWVARDINGDSFFNITADGSWDMSWNLFWNSHKSHARFEKKVPFQVFACWNGATAFTAKPLLKDNVRFRTANSNANECFQGEPQLFCKDLWFRGYRKIAVVPSVNLEYSVENGKRIKEAKGYTSEIVLSQDPARDQIEWQTEPPEMVRCMPTWRNQFWRVWNETLVP